jgi:hypothetical protein
VFSPRAFRGASASVIVLTVLIGSASSLALSTVAFADSGTASGTAGGATGGTTSDGEGVGGTSTASEKAGSASGSSSKGQHRARAGNVSVSVGHAKAKKNGQSVSIGLVAGTQAGAVSTQNGLAAETTAVTAGKAADAQDGGSVAAAAYSTPDTRVAVAAGSAGQSALAVSGKTITVTSYVPNGETKTFHKYGGEVSVSTDNNGTFSFAFANHSTAKAGVGQGSINVGLMGVIRSSLYAEAGADRFSAYAPSQASIGGGAHGCGALKLH